MDPFTDALSAPVQKERDPLFEGWAALSAAVAEHSTNDVITRNVTSLRELTRDEAHLIYYAMAEKSRSVVLPYAVNDLFKLKANNGRSLEATKAALYRAGNRLNTRKLGIVEKKDDGMLWFTVDEQAIHRLLIADRANQFNLMREPCVSPTTPTQTKKKRKKKYNETPANAKGFRLEAINYTKGVKLMDRSDKGNINTLFSLYNDNTLNKIVALVDEATGLTLGSEYSTRFNDVKKAAINLGKFDYAIEKSLEDYYRCCFLTLTTDPKLFDSNWDANRHAGKAWNKFNSFLKRRLGERVPFITAYEFTKKGYIHLHALIFVDYVLDHKEISKAWNRIGQGKIVYVYNLYNVKDRTGDRAWLWGKRRPAKAKARTGNDYIAKYLKKSLFAASDYYDSQANIQSLYWVFNKRFWSCSKVFLRPKDEPEEEVQPATAKFSFGGVIDAEDVWKIDQMIYVRGVPWEPDDAAASGGGG